MYRDHRYTSLSSGPPPPPGYDRYEAYPPPPPPSNFPPPPPPQHWDPRPPSAGRDSHYPRDRPDDRRFHGPFSDLRQPNGSYRDYRDDYRPPRSEFTFRAQAPASFDSYRPPAQTQYDSYHRVNRAVPTYHMRSYDDRSESYVPRHQANDRPRRPRGGQRANQQRHTGPYQRPRAVDRLLLSKRYDDKTELMLGDTAVRASYRDVGELSDSDEIDMDISDNGEPNLATAEPPTKRARTDVSTSATAQDPPKWSNPDPYTALPPPETTRKKDVVQLIRKARVEAEAPKPTAPDEAADFISCDFSDDESINQAQNGQQRKLRHNANDRVTNAPTGPRAASSILPPKPPISSYNHTPQHTEKAQTTQYQPPKPTKQSSKKSAPVDLTASSSLGNRKRTIDDEIKLPHAPLKKVNRMASGGGVVPNWRPEPGEDPCPWAIIDHSTTPNMGTRLHKEITDFYEYVRPREFEEKVRRDMVSKLEALIRKKWFDAKVLPFGSFMSGLYLPTADMDIAICSQSFINGKSALYDKKKYLWNLKYHLEMNKVAFRNEIEAVTKAKVPLLKYTDDYTGLKVDISFEKLDGQKAIKTFLKWKKQYPAMPPLVAIIKHFLLMRGLNEPVNGGIGGFSVICMVVHLLQQMPQVQSGSMKPEEHLGEVLMEFLYYYGKKHNYEQVAISMNPPRLLNKAQANTIVYRNHDRLSIIDPNNPDNDIAGGSSNYFVIKDCFSKSYDTLQETMIQSAREGVSAKSNRTKNTLLGPLFAGKYSNFEVQRNYLERLAAQDLPEYGLKGSAWDNVEW
ncbi:hypothetical protein F5Y19DRAFT_237576 [Xylariaceae sp. FL1651]|nr:hypothetical protein F5Y19DRAFT_237576 [Xylariaceae sp. FL1651]